MMRRNNLKIATHILFVWFLLPVSISAAQSDNGFLPVDKSISMMESRIKKNPKDFISRLLLGQLLVRRAEEADDFADFVKAEESFNKALEFVPNHPETKVLLAGCLLKQHRFREAKKLGEEVVKIKSSSISAISVVGDADLEMGNYDAAKVQFDRLSKIEPDAPAILARHARWHELNGSNKKAIELMKKAHKTAEELGFLESNTRWFIERLGAMHIEAGDHKQALSYFKMVSKIDPKSYQAHLGNGTVWLYEKEFDKSLKALEAAAKVRPNPPLFALISKVNILKGDKTAAAKAKSKSLQILKEEAEDERSAKAHIREAILIYADYKMNLVQAKKFAEEDLKVRPDIFSEMALAWVLYKQNKFAEAKEHAAKATRTAAENLDLNYKAGLIFLANNDYAAAKKHFDLIKKTNPKFSPPLGEKSLDEVMKIVSKPKEAKEAKSGSK